jgi:hypothetical protein
VETHQQQNYEKTSYGGSTWPVWVDIALGSVLAGTGGTLIAIAPKKTIQTKTVEGITYQRTNPQRQDTYYGIGGATLGVSIPFLVTGIYYATQTKAHASGEPQTVERSTRLNERQIAVPVRNEAVVITLPTGFEITANTNSQGAVTITLPEKMELYFPIKKDLLRISLPGKADWAVPLNRQTLAFLPPAIKQKADAIDSRLLRAKDALESFKTTKRAHLQELESQYVALTKQNGVYVIAGEIRDWNKPANQMLIWGTAEGEPGEGYAPSRTNIFVFGYDHDVADQTGYTRYSAVHCFTGKKSGAGLFGQQVPVRVYSSDTPQCRQITTARRNLEAEKKAYSLDLEQAKKERDLAMGEYLGMFPADPFGLKN